MKIQVPKAPSNLIWTGMEQFARCRYVYVRLQDYSVGAGAHQDVRKLLEELKNESAERRAMGKPGVYALNADPWLADQLFLYGNCELFGVTEQNTNMAAVRSKRFKKKR